MKTNTLVSAGAGSDENYVAAGEEDGPQSQTIFDFPPESFWVPKDSEQDWFHQNATMQRKSSFKLARFSVTGNCHHHHNSNPFSNRSLSTLNHHDHNKSSLLALPISDGNLWQNKAAAAATRVLFRSRSEPGGKGRLVTDGAEPGSPVVSCTGRVRPMKKDGGKKTGLWKTLRTALRGRLGVRRPRVVNNAGSESAGSAGAESGRWSGSLSGNNN